MWTERERERMHKYIFGDSIYKIFGNRIKIIINIFAILAIFSP